VLPTNVNPHAQPIQSTTLPLKVANAIMVSETIHQNVFPAHPTNTTMQPLSAANASQSTKSSIPREVVNVSPTIIIFQDHVQPVRLGQVSKMEFVHLNLFLLRLLWIVGPAKYTKTENVFATILPSQWAACALAVVWEHSPIREQIYATIALLFANNVAIRFHAINAETDTLSIAPPSPAFP
jgi:hypothetical protein